MNKPIIAIAAIVLAILTFVVSVAVSYALTEKYVTMESSVTHVDFVNDYYITVYFANGQHYNISTGTTTTKHLDFTDNSTMILRLLWSSVWIEPNTNDCWGLIEMIKYGG
jgi:hypothetical protein